MLISLSSGGRLAPSRLRLKRILALAAGLGLVAMLLPVTTGIAFAWAPPGITPLCSDVQGQYNWTVTLTGPEDNYDFQTSSDSSTWSAVIHGIEGGNAVQTSSDTLYVRWGSPTWDSQSGPSTNDIGRCTPSTVALFQKVIGSGGSATYANFSFTISQPGKASVVIQGSALDGNGSYNGAPLVGDYTITENQADAPSGYTPTYNFGGVIHSGWTGSCHWIAESGDASTPPTCIITNSYSAPTTTTTAAVGTATGSLIVEKDVTDSGNYFTAGGLFSFTVTCGGQVAAVNIALAPGVKTGQAGAISVPGNSTCTVHESSSPQLSGAQWLLAQDTSVGVDPGQTVTVKMTNSTNVPPPTGAVSGATGTPSETVPVTATSTSQPGGLDAGLPLALLLLVFGSVGLLVARPKVSRR